jgi:hypothetical protein
MEVFSTIISSAATTILAAFVTHFILQIVKNRLTNRYEEKSEELLIEYSSIRDATHAAGTMDILMQYNSLTNLAKSILRLKGYSVTGENLRYISNKLIDLDIFDESDIVKINNVRTVRNNVAHGTQLPTKEVIAETVKAIGELTDKLRAELIRDN